MAFLAPPEEEEGGGRKRRRREMEAHPIMYLSFVFPLSFPFILGATGAEEIKEPYYDGNSVLDG